MSPWHRACHHRQLQPAIAAGVAPEFLLCTILAAGDGAVDNLQVLERLREAFGTYGRFPVSLAEAVEASSPDLRATFEAARIAETMLEQMGTRAPAPKPAARNTIRP